MTYDWSLSHTAHIWMASLWCGLSDELAAVSSDWTPCHTHHTYSVSLPSELSDECEVLSCNRSFFHTHHMYETSLLGVFVDEDQSWRHHWKILYIHYTDKVSGLCEFQRILPQPGRMSHLVGGIQNFLSWSLDTWLSHLQYVARSARRKALHVVLLLKQSPSHFGSFLLQRQNSEMWTTEGSAQCCQNFTFRREYETWMNPENVQFVYSIVCRVLWFACQRKPRGGPAVSYPLSITKPIGANFLCEAQVRHQKLNLKNW